MIEPPDGGEPYPEPVEPPAAPGEESPIQAPQESPPPQPFDDTGRPTDTMLAQVAMTRPGFAPSAGAPAVL